jgi:hypothetical protein
VTVSLAVEDIARRIGHHAVLQAAGGGHHAFLLPVGQELRVALAGCSKPAACAGEDQQEQRDHCNDNAADDG